MAGRFPHTEKRASMSLTDGWAEIGVAADTGRATAPRRNLLLFAGPQQTVTYSPRRARFPAQTRPLRIRHAQYRAPKRKLNLEIIVH